MDFQLLNEHTLMTYLLDVIKSNDAPLQEAMTIMINDTSLGGEMNDFKATDSFLFPNGPVANKSSSILNHGASKISDATGV